LEALRASKQLSIQLFEKGAMGEDQTEYLLELRTRIKDKQRCVRAANKEQLVRQVVKQLKQEYLPLKNRVILNQCESFAQFVEELEVFYNSALTWNSGQINMQAIFEHFI